MCNLLQYTAADLQKRFFGHPAGRQAGMQTKGSALVFFQKVHALGRALTNKTSHAHGEKFSLIFVE